MGSRTDLSSPHPEWMQVADARRLLDNKAKVLLSLSAEELRKIPYQPAPLSSNAPVPGLHLNISQRQVTVRDGTDILIRIYQPLRLSKGHLLYFNIHGGGWTLGSPETEEEQNRVIAVENNAVVVNVDYRRAPEFPFPCPLNDSYDVFKWTLANAEALGADPKNVIIGGGSAGANMAAVIARMARDEGITTIKGQILNIPVTCHPDHYPVKGGSPAYLENAEAPIVDAALMRWFWKNYLPGNEVDTRASPLLETSLQGLPPALVQVAGMDPLRDEGIAYAEALRASGVNVSLKQYPGMPHAFYVYPEFKQTAEYHHTVVEWIKERVESQS